MSGGLDSAGALQHANTFRCHLVTSDAAYTYRQEQKEIPACQLCRQMCGAVSSLIAADDHMSMLTWLESV